jgi:peptidyl-prolyl cis-trans isomerase D
MLRGLRKASSNWLGKTVMAAVVGFLIISFGIWGIGDIFRGFGVSTVAKIGHTEISVDQFRLRYNEQLQQLSRQVGRPITAEQARAFGIEQQLLGQMIAYAALDERARAMRLGISDAEVARQITQDPAFRGLNGQFDQSLFLQRIRDIGFTEQRFVFEQRETALRRQLADAVMAEITPPKTAAQALDHYRDEERSIEYVTLDASKIGEIPAPTPEELSAYFEAHKVAFRAPEYRKVVLMTLSQEDVSRTIEVSDEDAKRAYEDRVSRYVTPERREVEQIVFPNAGEADAASSRLMGGLSFEDLVKERNLTDKDIDLGTVTKAEIIDPAIANAAFSLADGAVSAPVTGRFGTAIIRVVKIEPGTTKSFAEVEGDIKHDLAIERAKTEVSKIRDMVDEEFGGGATVSEIAQKLKLPLITADAVDRSGRAPDGMPVTGLPAGIDVINSAFATDIGNENDPLTLPDGGYVWYDVTNITPSRERTLDEVKDRVEAQWHEDEVIKRLDAKSAEMIDKLKTGTSLADLAAADQLMVETTSGLKRQGSEAAVPPRLLTQVFRTAKDAYGSAEGKTVTERVVFRVNDIKIPAFDSNSPVVKGIFDQLKNAYNDELLGQFVARVESDLGTSINQSGINQAVGGGAPNY